MTSLHCLNRHINKCLKEIIWIVPKWYHLYFELSCPLLCFFYDLVVVNFIISFRVTSVTMGESCNCPKANDATLKIWINYSHLPIRTDNITITKQTQQNSVHILWGRPHKMKKRLTYGLNHRLFWNNHYSSPVLTASSLMNIFHTHAWEACH